MSNVADRLGTARRPRGPRSSAPRDRARPRPPPRPAARRSRRTGGRPPCRRAPRAAPARARCPQSSTVWCPSTSQVALARHRQVEARVLAELLQHVIEERHARVGARPCPSRRASSSTVIVGLLRGARDGRRSRLIATSTSSSACRNRSVSCSVPGGDAQRVRHDRGHVADQHAAIQQPLPHAPSHRRAATNSTKLASRRVHRRARRSRESSRTIRSRCDADRVEQRRRLVAVAERRDPGGLGERRQVVGQAHPLQVLDDVGRRQHVADPRARQRERLRERPHDGDVRVLGDERQRRSAARTRRTPRRRSRAPPERRGERDDRRRAAARCRSGCWASRRTRRRRRARPPHATCAVRRARRAASSATSTISVCVSQQSRAVQQVGRLEGRRAPAGAAVGLQQLREDLVRAVRGPHARRRGARCARRAPRAGAPSAPSG